MPSTHLFSLVFHPGKQLQSLLAWLQRSLTDGEYKPGGGGESCFLLQLHLLISFVLDIFSSTAQGVPGAWNEQLVWPKGKAVLLLAAVPAIAGWKHLWNYGLGRGGILLVYADVCAGCHRHRPSRWLILALVFVWLRDQLAAKIDPAENFSFF